VILGGFVPGAVGSVAGFVGYDVFFIRPFDRLSVQSPENWIALAVYLVVVLAVAQVVSQLQLAREEAGRRAEDATRLFELSQALIGDLSLDELLDHIAQTVQMAFTPRWTALLLPSGTTAGNGTFELYVAASAGQALEAGDLAALTGSDGQTRSLGMPGGDGSGRVSIALVASNRPVGLLVLRDVQFVRQDRALLGTFANQAALAVERARLLDQALRSRLLEEIDRWRGALMGAVSHDLRTPLASIKTAVSSLRELDAELGPEDRSDLLELIELQSDRLARLVTNLLDMTRIESGALQVKPTIIALDELVGEALHAVSGLITSGHITWSAHSELPLLELDQVLIVQVLANVLENAARLSPDGSTIHIEARLGPPSEPPMVEIAVSDEGPGIDPAMREEVFEMFSQNGGGGRAGLGLAIAKAFVEAHGGTIWIDPLVSQGARVVFTVPCVARVPQHA
jgi:two-component system, OmpR family, sensor histidine kinase KdpD